MRPTILYIAGYGRSGSTLLDVLLSRHQGVISVGELRTLFRDASEGTNCSCGQPVAACERWGPIVDSVSELTEHSAAELAAQSKVAEGGPLLVRFRNEHRRAWAATLDLLARSTAADAIVDSSKTPRSAGRRPQLLNATDVADVYVIHLIRHPRGVLRSLERGSNRAIEDGDDRPDPLALLRLSVNWTVANVRAARARRTLGGVVVRYEDLVADPDRVVEGLLGGAGLHPETRCADVVDHGLSGNRARRQGFGQIRADDSDVAAVASRAEQLVMGLLNRLVYQRYSTDSG